MMKKGTYRTTGVLALLVGLAPLLSAQEAWHFTLKPEESRFTVDVGRAGFLKMFGHDHLVEIREYRGEVNWRPEVPETSSIRIEVDAASLTVVNEDDEEERAQIQADMETKALDIENHSTITFVSEDVSLEREEEGQYEGAIRGRVTLRGVTNAVTVPLSVRVSDETLRAQGEFEIKGTDFGIEQISAAGGTVKTSDDLKLTFDLVGARE